MDKSNMDDKVLNPIIEGFIRRMCTEPGASLAKGCTLADINEDKEIRIKYDGYTVSIHKSKWNTKNYYSIQLKTSRGKAIYSSSIMTGDDPENLVAQIRVCKNEWSLKQKEKSEEQKRRNDLVQNKIMKSIVNKLRELGHKIRFMQEKSNYGSPTIMWLDEKGTFYYAVALLEDRIILCFDNDGYKQISSRWNGSIEVNIGYNDPEFDPDLLEKKLIEMVLLTRQKFEEINKIQEACRTEIVGIMKTCQNTTNVTIRS